MAEDVRAEIVASVLEVVVSKGDQIGAGDTLVLLESMKMEIPVLAEVGGTITEVNVVGGRRHPGRRPHRRDRLAPVSTLGDLLAEHTMLPGSAVDHLHAVVGEWQLLADLSFADYLMWVRRDDGALVCVAQCRPNTAPTVLLTDAVGTVVAEGELPLVPRRSPRVRSAAATAIRSCPNPASIVEAVPVRYGDHVVAVLTHQTALAERRTSSPLEMAYLDCAGQPAADGVRGHLPQRRRPGAVAVEPAGRRRLHPPRRRRRRRLRQPQRAVGLPPDGLTAELEGHNLVAITRPLISDPFEAQELAEHVRRLAGGRLGHAAWRSTPAAPRC